MAQSLKNGMDAIPGFSYAPEQVDIFYDYVSQNRGKYLLQQRFAKSLDIKRLANMFSECSPAQKDNIRRAFLSVYRPECIRQFTADDMCCVKELKDLLLNDIENAGNDKVQRLQYQWFIENLDRVLSVVK